MRGCGRMRASSLLPLFSILALHCIAVEGCSSRSTPKPRPPSPPVSTSRPNVTFRTIPCPPDHAAYFCLNGGKCFGLNIGEAFMPNCDCADGFVGQRCEFKDLVGSYLSSRRVILETASIASGATIAVFLVVVICMFLYVRVQRKNKQNLVITREGTSREDLEKRAVSHRESLSYPIHHLSTERGDIRLAVYNVRVNTDPP